MKRGVSRHCCLIERWSPTLFLVGGTLLAGHAAVQGVEAFTDLAPPPDVFVTVGHLVALIGLVGLYPPLADRTPTTAGVATVVATIPLAGWFVMTAAQVLAVAGMAASLNDVLPGAAVMLVVVSTVLTYLLFGVATVRADGMSRIDVALVLAPGVLITALLVDAAATGSSAIDGVVIGGGLAVSMLGLGYRLQTWERSTGRAVSPGDVTAG